MKLILLLVVLCACTTSATFSGEKSSGKLMHGKNWGWGKKKSDDEGHLVTWFKKHAEKKVWTKKDDEKKVWPKKTDWKKVWTKKNDEKKVWPKKTDWKKFWAKKHGKKNWSKKPCEIPTFPPMPPSEDCSALLPFKGCDFCWPSVAAAVMCSQGCPVLLPFPGCESCFASESEAAECEEEEETEAPTTSAPTTSVPTTSAPSAPTTSAPSAPNGCSGSGAIEMGAIREFMERSVSGFAPAYADTRRKALAIDSDMYKDMFAAAATTFNGPSGVYDITLSTITELDGESHYRVVVDENQLGYMQNPEATTDYGPSSLKWSGVNISGGDRIQVEFNSHANGKIGVPGSGYSRGRWTKITFTCSYASPPVPPMPPIPQGCPPGTFEGCDECWDTLEESWEC